MFNLFKAEQDKKIELLEKQIETLTNNYNELYELVKSQQAFIQNLQLPDDLDHELRDMSYDIGNLQDSVGDLERQIDDCYTDADYIWDDLRYTVRDEIRDEIEDSQLATDVNCLEKEITELAEDTDCFRDETNCNFIELYSELMLLYPSIKVPEKFRKEPVNE